MEKSPQMTQALDQVSLRMFGRTRSASIREGKCVACGQPAIEFRDVPSAKEFEISGMCQECQNAVFDH
jgi:hypothetical protein